MANNSGITFNVGINVDDETVTRAVNILTWYCTDNNMIPISSKAEDGSLIIQVTPDTGLLCPCCGKPKEPATIIGFMPTDVEKETEEIEEE